MTLYKSTTALVVTMSLATAGPAFPQGQGQAKGLAKQVARDLSLDMCADTSATPCVTDDALILLNAADRVGDLPVCEVDGTLPCATVDGLTLVDPATADGQSLIAMSLADQPVDGGASVATEGAVDAEAAAETEATVEITEAPEDGEEVTNDTDAKTLTVEETAVEPESETVVETEAAPEAEEAAPAETVAVETEAEPASEDEAEAVVEAQVEAEAETEVEPVVEAEAEAETEATADTAAAPEADAEPAAEEIVVVEEVPAAAAAAAADGEATAEAEVATEEVTEDTARSSSEEFTTDATGEASATAAASSDGGGLSNFEKALILGLGAVAVGSLLKNGDEVVSNSGDRVVLRDSDGSLRVLKDDDALLRQPGSQVRTETFSDGSTRTTVTRDDGKVIQTIRAADGRVVRRARLLEDGSQIVLFDDTQESAPVIVSELPQVETETRAVDTSDEDALRRALFAAQSRDLGRTFSLRQVRQISEVRALAPQIEIDAITFATGSASIQPSQAEELASLGRVMQRLIEENPGEVFLIEGHTDATGPASLNLALSDRRAETVALALTEYFDVPPENIITQGYGESQLKIQTLENERANRRAVVRRVTDLLQVAIR